VRTLRLPAAHLASLTRRLTLQVVVICSTASNTAGRSTRHTYFLYRRSVLPTVRSIFTLTLLTFLTSRLSLVRRCIYVFVCLSSIQFAYSSLKYFTCLLPQPMSYCCKIAHVSLKSPSVNITSQDHATTSYLRYALPVVTEERLLNTA